MTIAYQLWWEKGLQDQVVRSFGDLLSLVEWFQDWKKRQLGMSLPDSDFYVVVYEKPGDQWPMQRMDMATAKYWSTRSEVPEAYKSDAAILKSLPSGQGLTTRSQSQRQGLEALARIERSVDESKERLSQAIETICREMAEPE